MYQHASHQRQQALNALGKSLTRRSHARCELCQAQGQKLSPLEVLPLPETPDIDHTLFLCQTCIDQIRGRTPLSPNHWHCLSTAIWSQIPPVQVAAVRLLKKLHHLDWARELEEDLYLEEHISDWVDAVDKASTMK